MRQKRSVRTEQDVRLRYAKQAKPSIPCPECGTPIEIDLLCVASGHCKICGLSMRINIEASKDALDAYKVLVDTTNIR